MSFAASTRSTLQGMAPLLFYGRLTTAEQEARSSFSPRLETLMSEQRFPGWSSSREEALDFDNNLINDLPIVVTYDFND
jgi:hypothetical protein